MKKYGILGATGRVGLDVIVELSDKYLDNGDKIKAIVRSIKDHEFDIIYHMESRGIEVVECDIFNREALWNALSDVTSVFVLTPEDPSIEHTDIHMTKLLQSYRYAIGNNSNIQNLVGLSSMGADLPGDIGNLKYSKWLENNFPQIPNKCFIRPAYYFSNWMHYYEMAKTSGFIQSFFPKELSIPMISPCDVASEIARVMIDMSSNNDYVNHISIYERYYTPNMIAQCFSERLGREIYVQEIPEENWESVLITQGFSNNAAYNMIQMMKTLFSDTITDKCINTPMTFMEYLNMQTIDN